MTEYQRIENELVSLGWEKEQGRGDHIKFSKDGVAQVITVSMKIGTARRAFQNACASIRRVEPRFSLGKQAARAQDGLPAAVPAAIGGDGSSWYAVGSRVRYTAPEGRDWSRLDDPEAVMNIPYEVTGLIPGDDGETRVELSDGSHRFSVSVREIDAWETIPCGLCGTSTPVNRLTRDDDGELLCAECIEALIEEKMETQKKEEGKVLLGSAEKKQKPEPMTQLSAEAKALMDMYNEMPPWSELSSEQRMSYLADIRKRIDALPAKMRKLLRAYVPSMFELIESELKEKSVAKTPYAAWKRFISQIIMLRCMEEGYRNKKASKDLQAAFYKTGYRTYVLKDANRRNAVAILEISAKEWDVAADMYRFKEIALSSFSFIGEKDGVPVCMLLIHQPSGLRQYLPSWWDERGDEALAVLKDILPEKERMSCLRKAETDSLGPRAGGVIEDISKWIGTNVPEIKVGTKSELHILLECGLREDDFDRFETAMPFWGVSLMLNTDAAPEGTLQKLEGIFSGMRLAGQPLLLSLMPIDDSEAKKTKSMSFWPEDYFDRVPANVGEDGTLTLFRLFVEDGHVNAECPVEGLTGEQKDSYMEDVAEGIMVLAEHCPAAIEGIVKGLEEVTGKTFNEKHKSNIMTKEKNTGVDAPEGRRANYLDFDNPGSANPEAGKLTTRELLKELKERGYEWTGLYRTIRQAVDDDDL